MWSIQNHYLLNMNVSLTKLKAFVSLLSTVSTELVSVAENKLLLHL